MTTTIFLLAVSLLACSLAQAQTDDLPQPSQPQVDSQTDPSIGSQPQMPPSNLPGTPLPTNPGSPPGTQIPEDFQRGAPQRFTLDLCEASAEVPCNNDVICLQLGGLRHRNESKVFYRCISGMCKRAKCVLDEHCEADEYCAGNGTCTKVTYVDRDGTCKPDQAILCNPPLQCNLRTNRCTRGLSAGASCDATGRTLWPPCPKDYVCVQWDNNMPKCTKQVSHLRQFGQTCTTSNTADPFTRCAEGLVCLKGQCSYEIVPKSLIKSGSGSTSTPCQSKCTENRDCATRICHQGECLERALLVGSKCDVSEQCVSGKCDKGMCSGEDCSTTTCSEEKICTYDRLQRKFLCVDDPTNCNDEATMVYVVDKCVMRPTKGENCEITGTPCVEPFHCDYQTKKCIQSETLNKPCAWSTQFTDNCTTLGREACQCEETRSVCKVVDAAKIIADRIPHSERCVKFTTRNSPLFNSCVRELSIYSPASSLFDVASHAAELPSCRKYWATFYCCSICMGVELDRINMENMTEKIQTYLPGLSCSPEPEWEPDFGSEDDKCILKGFTEAKTRSWYKEQLCGNFLEEFDNKSDKSEPKEEKNLTDTSSDKPSDAVPTQAGFSTRPAQPSQPQQQGDQNANSTGNRPPPVTQPPVTQGTQPRPPVNQPPTQPTTQPNTPLVAKPTTTPTQPTTNQQVGTQNSTLASSGVTASLSALLVVLFLIRV